MRIDGGPVLRRLPRLRARLWRAGYDYLAGAFAQPAWTFMNYGYAALDPDEPQVPLEPEEERSRVNIELYRRVLGPVPVEGRDVVEVGSGRGGGATYIRRAMGARSVVGVDYSARAVELCRRRVGIAALSFVEGSAERLPLPDASVDVVVNVESSHCYASMADFVAEVERVLRPGGHFAFADFRPAGDIPALRAELTAGALHLVEEVDITANVVRAMELMRDRKRALIAAMRPRVVRPPMRWFWGVEGGLFAPLQSGESRYIRAVLTRS